MARRGQHGLPEQGLFLPGSKPGSTAMIERKINQHLGTPIMCGVFHLRNTGEQAVGQSQSLESFERHLQCDQDSQFPTR